MEDLFETLHLLPREVQECINTFSGKENTYNNCSILLRELKKLGYTFDYNLDAEPYNLRKIVGM